MSYCVMSLGEFESYGLLYETFGNVSCSACIIKVNNLPTCEK